MTTSAPVADFDRGLPRSTGDREPSATAELIEAVFTDAPTAGLPSPLARSATRTSRIGMVLATAVGKTVLCVGVAAASVAGVAATTDRVELTPPDEPPPVVVEEVVPDRAGGPDGEVGPAGAGDGDVGPSRVVSETGAEIADFASTSELEGCELGSAVSELARFLSAEGDETDKADPCGRSDDAGPPPDVAPGRPDHAQPPAEAGAAAGTTKGNGGGKGRG